MKGVAKPGSINPENDPKQKKRKNVEPISVAKKPKNDIMSYFGIKKDPATTPTSGSSEKSPTNQEAIEIDDSSGDINPINQSDNIALIKSTDMSESDFLKKVNPLFLNLNQQKKRKEIINIESFQREKEESLLTEKSLNLNRDHPILKQKDITPASITVKYTEADEWGEGMPLHFNFSIFSINTIIPLIELQEEQSASPDPTNLSMKRLKKRSTLSPIVTKPREQISQHSQLDVEQFIQMTNQWYKTTIDPKVFVEFYKVMKNYKIDLWSAKLQYQGLFSTNSWGHVQIERFLCDPDGRRAQVLVVTGDSGTGKSQIVYTIAQKCKFDVFEINSSFDRTSQSIQNKFMEAIQSHHINMKKSLGNVILLDDVDIGDVSIATIKKIIEESRHPIIFTCQNTRKLEREGIRFQEVNLRNNSSLTSIVEQISFLYSISLSQGYKTTLEELYSLVMYCGGDMRKIVTNLQFWISEELLLDRVLGTIFILNEQFADVTNRQILDFWFRNVAPMTLEGYQAFIEMISMLDVFPDLIPFISRRKFALEKDQVSPGAILPLNSKYTVSNVANEKFQGQRRRQLREISMKAVSPFDVDLDLYDFMFSTCEYENIRKIGKRRHYHYLNTWLSEQEIDFVNSFKWK